MNRLHDPLTTIHLQRAAEALDIPPAAFLKRPTWVLNIACSSKIEDLQKCIDAVCPPGNVPNLVRTAKDHGEDAALMRGGAVVAVLLHRLRRTPVRKVKARKIADPRTLSEKRLEEIRSGYHAR